MPRWEDEAMNEPRKRHRWKSLDCYLERVQTWRCIKCDLLKITEYDSDNLYKMRGDGRTWYRFAPPCPPPDEK
jgi:hypothetical protein